MRIFAFGTCEFLCIMRNFPSFAMFRDGRTVGWLDRHTPAVLKKPQYLWRKSQNSYFYWIFSQMAMDKEPYSIYVIQKSNFEHPISEALFYTRFTYGFCLFGQIVGGRPWSSFLSIGIGGITKIHPSTRPVQKTLAPAEFLLHQATGRAKTSKTSLTIEIPDIPGWIQKSDFQHPISKPSFM